MSALNWSKLMKAEQVGSGQYLNSRHCILELWREGGARGGSTRISNFIALNSRNVRNITDLFGKDDNPGMACRKQRRTRRNSKMIYLRRSMSVLSESIFKIKNDATILDIPRERRALRTFCPLPSALPVYSPRGDIGPMEGLRGRSTC